MRAVRIRITDTLHYREISLFEQGTEIGHVVVQAAIIRQLDDVLLRFGNASPCFVISVIRVRHQGVESIIATSELDHDQNRTIFSRGELCR